MSHAVSTISRIRSFYMGEEIILDDFERAMLARWEEAFTFLRESKSIAETVTMLQRRFPQLSRRVLYKDVNSAMQLFGYVIKYSKEAMRNMTNDYAIDYLNRCRKSGDRNNEKAALAMLIKINKLEKDEEEGMDPNKMIAESPRIEIPEHVSSMIHALISNGSVNLMQLREKATLNLNERNDTVQPAPVTTGDSPST